MRTLERWYDIRVIFKDEGAKRISLSGNMKRYGDFSQVMKMLQMTGDVRFELHGNDVYNYRVKPSMATRGGKCVKLTKLINYIMKKNRNKSLPGGLWLVKNRLMMRMTIVLLLFLSFTAVAQNVTVKMKNSSFIQVAKEIQKQTELTFCTMMQKWVILRTES